MFGILGSLFMLGASLATILHDSTHRLTESNVIKDLGKLGTGLLDEGLAAVAYADQFLNNVNSPAFKKIVTLYKENEYRLESCREHLAADLDTASACFYITGDIANITQILINSTHEFSELFPELVLVLNEINACQNASIFKKYSCYKNGFEDFQALVKKYTICFNELLGNTTAVLQHLDIDIHNCFSHTDTTLFSEGFEKNIALCKLKMI